RTAQALLLVSVLVAAFLVGVGGSAGQGRLTFIDLRLVRWVALFDLLLSLLIACAIMLLGQAVVSYEVFTGKVLPRRGFFRQWRNTILLAMGYASFAGLSVVLGWRSVGSLVFDSVLLVGLSAGLSWRAFVERDQFIKRLRPFVSSQDLMQQMVGMPTKREMRAEVLFQSVCRDVLGAKQAQLVPLGVMASL